MTKRTTTTRTQRLHEGAAGTGDRRWTRLSKDADRDVLALVNDDYPVANVIRDLVDEALHVRHLNRAGRHPAVRELLRTFDEIINSRVQQAMPPLQQRLDLMEARQVQTNRFLSALFITLTEKFEFSAETSDEEADARLYSACAGEANEMTRLILTPQANATIPPRDPPVPPLRPLVAQELFD